MKIKLIIMDKDTGEELERIDLISNPEAPIFRTMAIYFYIGNVYR